MKSSDSSYVRAVVWRAVVTCKKIHVTFSVNYVCRLKSWWLFWMTTVKAHRQRGQTWELLKGQFTLIIRIFRFSPLTFSVIFPSNLDRFGVSCTDISDELFSVSHALSVSLLMDFTADRRKTAFILLHGQKPSICMLPTAWLYGVVWKNRSYMKLLRNVTIKYIYCVWNVPFVTSVFRTQKQHCRPQVGLYLDIT